MSVGLSFIVSALRSIGLVARGGFHPRAEDALPDLPDGRVAATLVLAGNVGPITWQAFQEARAVADAPLSLDDWTRAVLTPLAGTLGAHPLFPFGGPPYHPFQRWAQRAEPVVPSPIGPLIHPEYGLWHAYRGALAFAEKLELPAASPRPAPCESCSERPCLTACPVDAFRGGGFDVGACRSHIAGPAGRECLERGCLARRACPVGRSFEYGPEQMRFHMDAFLADAPEPG